MNQNIKEAGVVVAAKPTATAVPEGMVRVYLDTPLKTPNGEVSAITLRRGKAKDMMAAQSREKDAARGEMLLISMLTQETVTAEDLEELDMADLAEVQAAFQSLFKRKAKRGVAEPAGDVASEGVAG
ncbi:MAG: phage tail assembly protein [Burkholderiaceae bacterium]|nr:phage tail assembly protein [Burkholderiaceae bacterium]